MAKIVYINRNGWAMAELEGISILGEERPQYIPPKIKFLKDGSRQILDGNSGKELLRFYPDGRVYDYIFCCFLSEKEAAEMMEEYIK